MFTVIIATHDSERPLVATLAALVPGATAGVIREVIVADARSTDETEQVADIAGCVFFSSDQPLGAQLKAAAAKARGEWLVFLRPGAVPGADWIDDVVALARRRPPGAAVFGRQAPSVFASLFKTLPYPDQGLIIPKTLYGEVGGHRADASDPEADLLRRIGRSGLTVLRAPVSRA